MSETDLKLRRARDIELQSGIGKEIINIIQSRRSIREGFLDQSIPAHVLAEIIQCGLTAPSSKNAQPWRIHVVEDRATLGEVADAVESAKAANCYVPLNPATGQPRKWPSTVTESAQILREVSAGLFVENRGTFSIGRQAVANANEQYRSGVVEGYGFEMIGLGAMVQNMWLGAHAQGVEGVFMADIVVAESDIQDRLRFNGDLVGVLALGYTVQPPYPKILTKDSVVFHSIEEDDN